MKHRVIKVIALLLLVSFAGSCVSSQRTSWRRHRFNAHYRGEGRYWYK